MINDTLDVVREYWWLIIGISGFIAYCITVGIAIIKLRRDKANSISQENDRTFWKWFGVTSMAVYIYMNFSSIPSSHSKPRGKTIVLYHTSEMLVDKLIPAVGGNRHSGEDPRAVGKSVVWLSNQIMCSDPPFRYLYEVELDENDPELIKDAPFDILMQKMNKQFQNSDNLRWYFTEKTLDVLTIKVWNSEKECYELE